MLSKVVPSSFVAVVLVACSSSDADRTPFADDAGSPPPAPTQTTPTPAPTQTSPIAPTGDASTPDPDCTTAAPSHRCGVVPQCGCADSETCDVVDAAGNVRCVAFGKAPMGHPCTATAGCRAGLTCIFGTCHAFCADPGKPCGEAGTGACIQVQAQGGAAIPNLSVCMVECAPHDPASCGGETNAGIGVCLVDGQGGTDCREGGTGKDGDVCGADAPACGPGLACVQPSSGPDTCRRWCRVGTADCGGAVTCNGFSSKVEINGVEYGACP